MILHEKVNKKECYRIFYSTEQTCFILACIITETVWYENYFFLTKEEYDYFISDMRHLNRIAESCFILGRISPRFLGSQKIFENRTERQQQFAKSITAEINQNNKKLSEGI